MNDAQEYQAIESYRELFNEEPPIMQIPPGQIGELCAQAVKRGTPISDDDLPDLPAGTVA